MLTDEDRAVFRANNVHNLLNQTKQWPNGTGRWIRLADMDDAARTRAASTLMQQASKYALDYSVAERKRIIGVDMDGKPILEPISASLEGPLSLEIDARLEKPLSWMRTMPLYVALTTPRDLPHGYKRWQTGCICTVCRAAAKEIGAAYPEYRRAMIEFDTGLASHNAHGYTEWNCRCSECCEAQEIYATRAANMKKIKRDREKADKARKKAFEEAKAARKQEEYSAEALTNAERVIERKSPWGSRKAVDSRQPADVG